MERLIPLPINGPSQAARSGKQTAARTVNWYPQVEQPGGLAQITLHPDPGNEVIDTVGTGPTRCNGEPFQSRLYFVTGNELVSFAGDGTYQAHGTIGTSQGRVKLIAGRALMLILDGSAAYSWDGTTLAVVADTDMYQDAEQGTILNSTFVVVEPATDTFQVSDDGTTYAAPPTDAATAELDPDVIKVAARNRGNLVLLGVRTTEIWTFTGNASFPFEPLPGAKLDWGSHATWSWAETSVGLFGLATNAEGGFMVVRIDGPSVTPISQDIDWELGQLDVTEDAEGLAYQMRGRWYYALTFPSAGRTFVYNIQDGMWHERQSPGLTRWRVGGHGYIGNRHIIGDYTSGVFYTLTFDSVKDNGTSIQRRRVTNPVHKDGRRIRFNAVWLIFEGTGDLTDEGRDPEARLRFSDNGGKTWSDWLEAPIGRQGEYDTVAVFTRLGVSRNRTFEIEFSYPVPASLIKAYMDARVLDRTGRLAA